MTRTVAPALAESELGANGCGFGSRLVRFALCRSAGVKPSSQFYYAWC